MKLYICSDIHGSYDNLNKFFNYVDADIVRGENVRVIVLGDIYNHGPRNPFPNGYAPMKVAELLNSHKDVLTAIKGNCDSEVDQMISEFTINNDFFAKWGEHTLFFTHGHKCNAEKPKAEAKAGDAVFYGHFHVQDSEEVDGVKYVCVGAIGLCPKDFTQSFAVVKDDKVTVLSLDEKKTLLEFNL